MEVFPPPPPARRFEAGVTSSSQAEQRPLLDLRRHTEYALEEAEQKQQLEHRLDMQLEL